MPSPNPNRSAPPPYSTRPATNLAVTQAGGGQQEQGIRQQPQQGFQTHRQVHQFPDSPQGFASPPQPQTSHCPPAWIFPTVCQHLPPGTMISPPFHLCFAYQSPIRYSLTAAVAADLRNSVTVIPAPAQTGFVPHLPAVIPGIPGVHRYPLFVDKEGEGPPPLPVFVSGFEGGYTGYVMRG